MKTLMYGVTSDTDDGLFTTIHANQHDAYLELKFRFCSTQDEEAIFERLLTEKNYAGIDDYVATDEENRFIVSWNDVVLAL